MYIQLQYFRVEITVQLKFNYNEIIREKLAKKHNLL